MLQPLFSTVHTDSCMYPNTQPPPKEHVPDLPFSQPAIPNPLKAPAEELRVSPRYPARALYNQHHFCRQWGCTPCASLSFPFRTDTSPNNSHAPESWGGKVGYGVLTESKTNGFKESLKGAWRLLKRHCYYERKRCNGIMFLSPLKAAWPRFSCTVWCDHSCKQE